MFLGYNTHTLADLKGAIEHYGATDVFAYKASFSHISDPVLHQLKNAYIDARQAVLAYLNDESVMQTPLNEAREAIHGWEGYTTVADIALVCQTEGLEYGLLHKSNFLSVDDATVHALIEAYADAHYALLNHIGVEGVRSTRTPFTPID